MSNKQKLILCLVIIISSVVAFDRCYETNIKYSEDIASKKYEYAKFNADNYRFNEINSLERLKKLSFNTNLDPGEYEVIDLDSQEGENQIYSGWYLLKNEDYNDRAKVIINDNEYIIECNDKECIPDNYYGVGTNAKELAKDNKYIMYLNRKLKTSTYTIPSNIFFNFDSNFKIYNTVSIIKTFILSLIYIIIGYFLFLKRKMEVSETSFKSVNVHNIVKCLTMVPILSFVYLIIVDSNIDIISMLILLVIVIAYYFIYDLITKKSITNLKRNIFTLVFYIPLFMLVMKGIDTYLESKQDFSVDDVKSIKIENVSNGNYDSRLYNIYFEDKELFNYLLTHTGYGTKSGEEYIDVNFKLKNNQEFNYLFRVSNEDIDNITSIISKNKEVQDYINDIDYDRVYTISLRSLVIDEKYKEELKEVCRKYLPNSIEASSDGLNINMYSYTDHDVKKYEITTNNNIIKDKIMEIENKSLKEDLNNYEFQELYLYVLGYNLEREGERALYEYILDNNNTVNSNKDYTYIEVSNYKTNKYYRYYTNDIDKINEIIDKYKIDDNNSEEYYYD